MENKINKTWVILMFIGVLLVIGVTVSFSYYGISVKTSLYDSGPNFKVGVNSTATGLTVTKLKDIDLQNKKPGYKDIIILSVATNDTETTTTYNLELSGTNSIETGITYTVYKTNERKTPTVSCNETNDEVNSMYYDTCTINDIGLLGSSVSTGTINKNDTTKTLLTGETIKNSTIYYYIILEYPDTNESQDIDFNTIFNYTTSINVTNSSESSNITCVDDNGDEMTCDFSTPGQRIAISAENEPTQYFRYIRTTDTTSNLNECGTDSSVACKDTDTSTVGIPGTGYIRALAEYNLNVGSNKNPSVAEGMQHESVRGDFQYGTMYGNIAYGPGAQYSTSNVKTYIDNYATLLNTKYGVEVIGSAITKEEIMNLCSISGSGKCANTYPWVYTTSYWSGSRLDIDRIWYVTSSGAFFPTRYSDGDFFGARATINILASSI